MRYRSYIADSARWEGFALRADDVIVTTPPKSGTTWMQTCVALLLFDGLPDEPVYDLSPWLDMNLRSTAQAHALLDAQTHRRWIKTHTPLDGLPWDDRVTYITVGRDPRDVFVSMLAHLDNLDDDVIATTRSAAVGDADLDSLPHRWPDTDDPRELTAAFLELDRGASSSDMALAHVVHHLRLAWEARERPNVHLFHFADMRRDLAAQMQRLATALGVEVSPDRLAELAEQATFDAMKARASDVAPEANQQVWRDASRFFRGGRSGDGAAAMTADERARFDERLTALAGDDRLASWIVGGWGVLSPAGPDGTAGG